MENLGGFDEKEVAVGWELLHRQSNSRVIY